MLKITIDFKVLGREDKQIVPLCKLLMETGNMVVVFVDAIDDKPAYKEIKDLFEKMGIVEGLHYTFLVRFKADNTSGIARFKAEYCRDHKINIALEIDDTYIADINKLSPQTNTYLLRRYI